MKPEFLKALTCLLFFSIALFATAQTVEYKVVYNPEQCNYEAHAYFLEGAVTFPGTIPFPSVFSIVVPAALADDPIAVVENVNPPNMVWADYNSIYQPAADPQHDFHAFSISGGSADNAYANLEAGDDIHLFSFEIPGQICEAGVRTFIPDFDPNSAAEGMQKIDFTPCFKLFAGLNLTLLNNIEAVATPVPEPLVNCTASEITLDANAGANCLALSFEWSGPGNFSASTEVAIIPITENPELQSGIYTLVVTDEDGCTAQRAVEVSGANCLTALPVNLLAFQGAAFEDHNLLSWQTEHEFKNLYFELERSSDAINFEAFAKVDGNLNTNEKHFYEARDQQPFNETYYRLKQVDQDGRFAFSEVILVSRTTKAFQLLDVYPNPVVEALHLVYEVPAQTTMGITITDAKGEVLYQASLAEKAGLHTETIDTRNLSSGIYFIKIENDKENKVSRFFVKQK